MKHPYFGNTNVNVNVHLIAVLAAYSLKYVYDGIQLNLLASIYILNWRRLNAFKTAREIGCAQRYEEVDRDSGMDWKIHTQRKKLFIRIKVVKLIQK